MNYGDLEKQRLADEAINKIRLYFHEKAPAGLFCGEGEFREIRLSSLGQVLEWKDRYFEVLGKMIYFLENFPLCQQQFSVGNSAFGEIEQKNGGHVLSLRESLIGGGGGGGDGDGDHAVMDDNMINDDSDSVVSSMVVDPPTEEAELQALNQRAFAAIKDKLIHRAQEDPPCSMKLTALNTVVRWYTLNTGWSLKQWALAKQRRDELHYIYRQRPSFK
jgi:hypothetical protein